MSQICTALMESVLYQSSHASDTDTVTEKNTLQMYIPGRGVEWDVWWGNDEGCGEMGIVV